MEAVDREATASALDHFLIRAREGQMADVKTETKPEAEAKVERVVPPVAGGLTWYNAWAAPIAVTTTRHDTLGRPIQVVVAPGQDIPADASPGALDVLAVVGYVAVRG